MGSRDPAYVELPSQSSSLTAAGSIILLHSFGKPAIRQPNASPQPTAGIVGRLFRRLRQFTAGVHDRCE